MKLTISRQRLSNLILYLSYALFLSTAILSKTFFFRYFIGNYKFILLICFVLLLISQLFTKINFQQFINFLYLLVLDVIIVSISFTNNATDFLLPLSLLYIFTFRNTSFRQVAKFSIFISTVTIFVTIISSKIGIIPDYIRFESFRERHFIGFLYALYAPTLFRNVTLLYIYIRNKSISYLEILFLFIINYGIYFETKSRLTFFVSVISLLLVLIHKNSTIFSKRRRIFTIFIPIFIVVALISLYFSYYYNPMINWQSQFNEFLGGRLNLAQRAVNNFGIDIFGKHISFIGSGLDALGHYNATVRTYNYVDNFYISMLLKYGILFTVSFVAIVTLLLYKIYKRNNIFLLIILCLVAIHGFIDDTIIDLYFNTFWLLFALLFNNHYFKDSESE